MMTYAWNALPMMAGMVLFWLAIVALVVWLVKDNRPRAGIASAQAVDIIDQRYARGEIDEDQWVRIRTGLDKRQ
ncbi:hypothetical protein CFAL_03935 [Corynebacterium falsenii DSM 44353]|uniref:Electron transporter RnfE n=3 Tax=Propionibacteriaceae TaxID=31957 RepID=A0A3Q9UJQ8_9ACTN|nr:MULTISPECIES: hypothetical protein [Actinomycetes]AHI02849.1 hypothetical protein CFAL_03935 [Corynebacterium falsenii DSM 44353]CEP26374.1 Protein of unknown function [Propionibacterium freudenreichii subsp. freudenreichii]AZZ40396.1 electron transporter RnfE [Acidipropionibacterium jensenii]MCT2992227.1 SHOCT domain-containing protein [Propionibacterium freudenreichii]MCT2992607.1 SHOCT domain-containing protein [Propionibacterium freudenreichii]